MTRNQWRQKTQFRLGFSLPLSLRHQKVKHQKNFEPATGEHSSWYKFYLHAQTRLKPRWKLKHMFQFPSQFQSRPAWFANHREYLYLFPLLGNAKAPRYKQARQREGDERCLCLSLDGASRAEEWQYVALQITEGGGSTIYRCAT
jgi:hypothetical protein